MQISGFVNPTGKQGSQEMFEALIAAGSIGRFKSLTPLPKNTQELIDDAVVRIGRERLVITEDLIAARLTKPLPNWLSVPTITHHELSESGHANRGMVPVARGERQIADLDTFTLPVFCTWDDFSFDVRELAAAERVGYPLDITHVEQAIRNVNWGVEDATINGGPTIGGNAVAGLMGSTNTFTYTDNEAWDAAGHSGKDIYDDVISGINVLRTDKFYGPYNLYVPTAYGAKLSENYSDGTTTFDMTIRERLEKIMLGGRPLRVREADLLAANRTLIVQMTSDVVDVIVGQTPTDVSWAKVAGNPFAGREFLILACVITRLKVNYDGNYGVAVGNTS